MESKFYSHRYNWSTLSVIVDCSKCGNNIVLQNFDGNPKCSDCGNINKKSWENIIKAVDLPAMKKANSDHKIMMGTINGKVQLDNVDSIPCYHCKQALTLPEQSGLENYLCNHCNQSVSFKEYEGMDELVFYKASSDAKIKENVQMIAVRCVSCGAPLEADPTKNNFHCKFCSTENILPVSLRYKVVLDDIFVSERMSKIPKLQAFVIDGKIVKQALREYGKESFNDMELGKVLLDKKDDSDVYHQIMNEFKYLPSDSILKEIFNTSKNETVIKQVGLRLQKTPEEIKYRISGSTSKPEETKQVIEPAKHETSPKSRLKSPFMVVILIVFIITIIAMVNLFLK